MAFEIRLNGETIHEFDQEMEDVVGVRVLTSAGEAGRIGSPLFSGYIDVVLDTRNVLESDYLDVVGARDQDERRTRVEEASVSRVEEGRRMQSEEDERREAEQRAEAAAAPVAAETGGGETANLNDMTKAELQAEAERRGVSVSGDMTKAEMISAMENQGSLV